MEDQSEEQVALISRLHPAANTYAALHPQLVQENKGGGKRKRKRKEKDSEAKKRKLSWEQAKLLEKNFEIEHKLKSERKDGLASELGLDPKQVGVWFQNRRVRWKKKNLDDQVFKLRDDNNNLVLQKCQLQLEVSILKEQLNNAKKEIQRVMESLSSSSSSSSTSRINTPNSSLTLDYHAQPLGLHFDLENMFCDYQMDWVNLFNYSTN